MEGNDYNYSAETNMITFTNYDKEGGGTFVITYYLKKCRPQKDSAITETFNNKWTTSKKQFRFIRTEKKVINEYGQNVLDDNQRGLIDGGGPVGVKLQASHGFFFEFVCNETRKTCTRGNFRSVTVTRVRSLDRDTLFNWH